MGRRREENSIYKYLCLRHLTKFRRDVDRMRQARTRLQTQALVKMEPEEDEEANRWWGGVGGERTVPEAQANS